MMPSLYCRAVAPVLLASLFLSVSPLARAQPVPTIDLPAQSLADSLRAVASATHTNIAFDATAIAGVRAQPLNGRMTAAQAVASLLARTELHWVSVDAHTIRVEANDPGGRGPEASDRSRRGATKESEATGPSSAANHQNGQSEKSAAPVELSEVVVTGTHIHGAASPSPTLTITRKDIERSGYIDVGDVLRSLPQNFSAGNNPQTAPANTPTQGNANFSGGSSPNLRGLGPESTLTLINGHRLGQDGVLGAVDITMIPLSAIERIDVVTDSSSAAYGSDAVAGVVNFILRKDYQGVETSGTLGTSTDGGGYEREINQLMGGTWNSGGALFAYEHQHQDAVRADQREFTSAAADPTSLLPQSSRNSGFLSAHQNITDGISISADGLYTSRESKLDYSYPPTLHVQSVLTDEVVRQYLTDAGINADLAHQWHLSAFVSAAAERNLASASRFSPGVAGVTLQIQQLLRGTTRVAELAADGPIWNLGADAVRAAVGGGYRQEGLDWLDTVGGSSDFRSSRGVRYAYAELNAPLASIPALSALHSFDLNISGRYESYTDLGSKVVPKIGFLFSPVTSIEMHATWSEAYRAPTLYSLHGSQPAVYLLLLPDPLAPSGASLNLVRYGANPQLRPETAESWTFGVDLRPSWLEGASASLSYFDIHYTGRVQGLGNTGTALTDPGNSPLVTRDPSAALQQAVIDSASGHFYNYSGMPYRPSAVASLVDGRDLNIAEQDASGVDLHATYEHPLRETTVHAFIGASYMQLRQRTTPASPEQELAGRTFNPPRFRARGGVTWTEGAWEQTGILNFVGRSVNAYVPTLPSVSSWTTVDLQLSYAAPRDSIMAGLKVSLSVQNILDQDPPFAQYFGNAAAVGFDYDSNNFTPMGRYVSLQISKSWFTDGRRQ